MLNATSRRGSIAKKCGAAISAGVILIGATGLVANPAQAAAQSDKIPLAISIGDSFISGEGGRFAGSIYSSSTSDGAEDKGPHNMGSGVYENAWGGREFENIKHPQGGFLDSSQACH